MKFKYADAKDLITKVQYMFKHQEEAKKMGENGYKLIETVYSPEAHYQQLVEVFNKVLKLTE